MKKILVIFLTIFALKVSAVLPPFHQSVKEIQQILSDERLKKEIPSGEPILEIIRVENGYLIYTNKYILEVEIEYLPQKMPGPAQFKLHFNEKQLISQ
ncbi:MAG: hypothetical protein JXA94_07060 [Parachlamydiales bacterium]|nr:hypothetical protein [Parachlamydiales bacterium]